MVIHPKKIKSFFKIKEGVLCIISDSDHYYDQNGSLFTWPLLAKQFDSIAKNFDKVLICSPCLRQGMPEKIFSKYKQKNIFLIPLSGDGGDSFFRKVILFFRYFEWYSILKKIISKSDLVHVRFPDAIGLLGLFLLKNQKIPCFGIYTGTWETYPSEPNSYKLIKYVIRKYVNFPFGVYTTNQFKEKKYFNNISPSYSKSEIDSERYIVEKKILELKNNDRRDKLIRLLTVGNLSINKNQIYILKSLKYFIDNNKKFILNVVGEGEELQNLKKFCHYNGLKNVVNFYGQIGHEELRDIYRSTDFVIQSPMSEGFGKVPIESFVHGAIPILSNVGISNKITAYGKRGLCFELDGKHKTIFDIVANLLHNEELRIEMINSGYHYVKNISLESWVSIIDLHLKKYYL